MLEFKDNLKLICGLMIDDIWLFNDSHKLNNRSDDVSTTTGSTSSLLCSK
jgi:hypothetical protein